MIRRCLIRGAPLCALLALAPAAAQAPEWEPRPCPGPPTEARCGTVRVPENRDAPGRRLDLNVLLLPARASAPAREAIVFFGGGPGQAVTQIAPYVAPAFAPLRDARDLLFIDQRGTGGSAPLQCALRDPADPRSYLGDYLPAEAVARCREELSRVADLARYGTRELAHDVEAVRMALGYERLDLNGVSYGTRAALAYLRAYPERVRSAVLRGLVPPEFAQPAGYARDMDAALEGLFAECRADEVCNLAFPDPHGELRAVADRLAAAPGSVEIMDPESGRRVRLGVTREIFVETIRRMLYEPLPARSVPYVVRRAYRGDYRGVALAALQDRRLLSRVAWWGLHLAITCSEDVPFIDRTASAAKNGRTLAGDYRLRQYLRACRGWPTFAHPEQDRRRFRSDVPALLISGALDPVTPPHWGDSAAAIFPNGLHLVIPHAAHAYGGMEGTACVDSLVIRFYRQGSARGLDTSCLRGIRPPPFPPGSSSPSAHSGDAEGGWMNAGGRRAALPAVTVARWMQAPRGFRAARQIHHGRRRWRSARCAGTTTTCRSR